MYKLKKNEKGKVSALLRTGKDFVKNDLSVSAAQHIIDNGEVVKSDKPDFPICVDEQWYFEGEEVVETPVAAPKEKQAYKNDGFGKKGKKA